MNKTLIRREKTISILGCGWLGLPLAKFLLKKGYQINGSTSTPEKLSQLSTEGINPYLISFDPEINADFDADFFHSDLLIINFPPKQREAIEEYHSQQIKALINQLQFSTIKKVIFISSTSVYANVNKLVTEKNKQTPEKSSGKALRIVEEILLLQQNFKTSIIRFGGLIGYDRKPGRFFSKMKQAVEGQTPVNLIHRDDCIGTIFHLIENDLWGEIYNACCPEHPTREDFYKTATKIGGFEIPKFVSKKSSCKTISSEKLIRTNYTFKYNNPIDAIVF
ncbi:hypothetical protein BZG02_19950 [Labilibaculum filiforme]|uniref:Uncharacterized protein n=1 Tax=Labilibaculum filiforme TaxID=1940526 RepID=A0A2N3HQD5_9BACT|nr:NAD(P)H-binding protein [Labilibaculum filiforme]PKQ60274.1 hypothetical protein BZG02_19950 [Labilibaculum filiforme]